MIYTEIRDIHKIVLVCHTYQRPPFTHSPTWLQKIWEGNGKCRGCLYRRKSHLSDVVAQREAKGILCRPACAMCVQSLAHKQRAQKSDFKRGNWGQGLEPFCSESNYTIPLWFADRKEEKFRYLHVKTYPLVLP